MPTSFSCYDRFAANILSGIKGQVLDVGPGSGKYSQMVPKEQIDAVEIYEPYIKKFSLNEKYNKVIVGNILNIDTSAYSCIIFGDVLEHIAPDKASLLIDSLSAKMVIVQVPYENEQGEYDGNIHETHLQPDLTHEIMKKRYPSLQCIRRSRVCGMYVSTSYIVPRILISGWNNYDVESRRLSELFNNQFQSIFNPHATYISHMTNSNLLRKVIHLICNTRKSCICHILFNNYMIFGKTSLNLSTEPIFTNNYIYLPAETLDEKSWVMTGMLDDFKDDAMADMLLLKIVSSI